MKAVKVFFLLCLIGLVLQQCSQHRSTKNEPLIGSPVKHGVTEKLTFSYYEAMYSSSGQSIYSMLQNVSPIRQDGKIYLGYTSTSIEWVFNRFEHRDGRCRLTDVEVKYSATITLPKLRGAGEVDMSKFESFLTALRRHEMGHYDIGREIAEKIDKGVSGLPEMPSCKQLDLSVNDLGNRILEDSKNMGSDYDRVTDYGRSQGAWLDF